MFSTFSKNQQFWELFQKRFATGICDLRGIRIMYSFPPYSLREILILEQHLNMFRHLESRPVFIGWNPIHGPHPLKSQIPVAKRFWKSSLNCWFFEKVENLNFKKFENTIISRNYFLWKTESADTSRKTKQNYFH